MFDQILQLVKEHIGNDPQVAAHIPAEQADAVHQEIATHLTEGIQNQAAGQGEGGGGLLSMLSGSLASGNLLTNSIAGGLVGSLAGKFGLGSAATGAIAAALPGLLQKFLNRNSDPQNPSPSSDGLLNSIPGLGGSGSHGFL